MKTLLLIPCLLLLGCETLTEWQQKPAVQFAESEAIKLAAAYFSNGGSVDSAWGVSNGLSIVGDVATFAQQQHAANANALAGQTAAKAVKDFAGSRQAVNGLANGVANLVVEADPKTASQRAAIVQAIANGIGQAAQASSP